MPNQKTNQQQGQAGQQVVGGYAGGAQQQAGMQNANTVTSAAGTSGAAGAATSAAGTAGSAGQNTQAVVGVFQSRRNAEQAVQQLRQQGFTSEEINIISKRGENGGGSELVEDDVTDGALTGGTLGGIGGLILGAGALAIPGVGPIIAAGPIAAALSGAVAGGITGGLIDWGIPAEVSRRYEQSVAQGGILAVIRTDSQKVGQAAQVLRQNGAQDVESHSDPGSAR